LLQTNFVNLECVDKAIFFLILEGNCINYEEIKNIGNIANLKNGQMSQFFVEEIRTIDKKLNFAEKI